MRIKSTLATIILGVFTLVSCDKGANVPAPKPAPTPDPDPTPSEVTEPAPCKYNVVAHRGGSSECGLPDNSRASLRYAMGKGCYASECDIYWTKDNDVIVAHADGSCAINGLHPWEATVAEIRAKGKLSNGEEVPTLGEFIDIVMEKGSCTRLWLDIKNITSPSTLTDYPIAATKRACEIIKEKKAQKFVEFICTGNATVWKGAFIYTNLVGCNNGWMSNSAPSNHKSNNSLWANLAATVAMSSVAGGTGTHTVQEFVDAGMSISVFNVDMKNGDGNAVYADAAVQYYLDNYPKMKAICTNYPAWLMGKLAAKYPAKQ